MMRQAKLCVVLLALAVCGYGLPRPGFCADYNQVEDFGVKKAGDIISFTVTPPQNAEGKNARVTSGYYDNSDLLW